MKRKGFTTAVLAVAASLLLVLVQIGLAAADESAREWGPHFPNEWRHPFQRAVFMDGNPQMYLNDQLRPVLAGNAAATPRLVNGALLIPYETAVDTFGGDIDWSASADKSAVTASRGNVTVALNVGGQTMQVGDDNVSLAAAPAVVGGVLYVPAADLASALRLYVGWDEESGVLIVTSDARYPQTRVTHGAINSQPEAWYGSDESIRIANNLLVYQRNSGGWVENIDMTVQMTEALRLQLERQKNNADASLDNGVTIPEIRYLIKMHQATKIERYREAFLRGINGVLGSQYPNGGFPQRFNQPTSYHGEITYNDNAMTQVLRLWWDIYSRREDFFSIDDETFAKIEDSLIRGIDVILDTQVYSEKQGMLTAWGAQHDRVTLEPSWARDYEPPSISGSESVGIINFLMSLDREFLMSLDQDNVLGESQTIWERVQNAVHSAARFFAHVEIVGYELVTQPSRWGNDRALVENPEGRGLWARFIDIDTFEPLFFDRRSPNFRPGELETYRPLIQGAMPGKHYPRGGNLRNLYRDAEGNLHPITVGPNGGVIRPEGAVFDLPASYANLSHERRNGYNFVGGWAVSLPTAYQAWLERNNLSPQ